jgi:hypothetical protein
MDYLTNKIKKSIEEFELKVKTLNTKIAEKEQKTKKAIDDAKQKIQNAITLIEKNDKKDI